MANMFTPDINNIRQLLQDVDMELIHLHKNLSDQFGDEANCMKVWQKASDHIGNALSSLRQLNRVIPSDYIDESSKLESRINRLERLMK